MSRAHIIVVGNAKGGSGKSTTAMHIIARLLTLGHRVAAIDLDARQQTLARYIENRATWCEARNVALVVPRCHVAPTDASRVDNPDAYAEVCALLEGVLPEHDYVVIDCPGSDNFVARLGHSFADTLVTPLNDSFIDVDLLARIDADSFRVIEPSWYSEMVWEQRKRRFLHDGHRIDWVVMRNRLQHTDARNKRHVGKVLEALAPTLGFRQVHGLGERVIFRELFLKGLTLSDLGQKGVGVELTMTHVAAHHEVRDLVGALNLRQRQAAGAQCSPPRTERVAATSGLRHS